MEMARKIRGKISRIAIIDSETEDLMDSKKVRLLFTNDDA
jgi:hypothetical protein